MDGVKHSLITIPCCPLALVNMQPHPVPLSVRQISANGKQAKLTDLACSLCNKLFYKKWVSQHHKIHKPNKVEDYDVCHILIMQTVPMTWLWMILNSHYILNYIIPVSANKCTAWSKQLNMYANDYTFLYFLFNIFFLIKQILRENFKTIS